MPPTVPNRHFYDAPASSYTARRPKIRAWATANERNTRYERHRHVPPHVFGHRKHRNRRCGHRDRASNVGRPRRRGRRRRNPGLPSHGQPVRGQLRRLHQRPERARAHRGGRCTRLGRRGRRRGVRPGWRPGRRRLRSPARALGHRHRQGQLLRWNLARSLHVLLRHQYSLPAGGRARRPDRLLDSGRPHRLPRGREIREARCSRPTAPAASRASW